MTILENIEQIEQRAIANLPKPGRYTTANGLSVIAPQFGEAHYVKQQTRKTAIVLHHTAGLLPGDIASLSGERGRVSTAFLIARNGTVIEMFNPKYWSYHLGRGAIGGNHPQSMRTIGVELSNVGNMELYGNVLRPWFARAYCRLEDTSAYKKLDAPYRGYQYFATYTEQQYQSLRLLLDHLCAQFQIPKALLPEQARLQTVGAAIGHIGILSHVNYTRAGKWDVSPSFDYSKI